MAASRATGRRVGQSGTSILWVLVVGLALVALYLVILDWSVLVRWMIKSFGHL